MTFLFEGQTATQERDRMTEWITRLRTQGYKVEKKPGGSRTSRASAAAKSQEAGSRQDQKATAEKVAAEEV